LLHRPDVRAVHGEQNIAVNLQMVGSGIFRGRDKSHGLGVERIAHVDDGISIAEHMPDEGVPLMKDDLYAVRPAALIAARQETNIFGAGAGNGIGHADRAIENPQP
jgi:hypothetical protein